MTAVERANATDRIEVVDPDQISGIIDAYVKLPPAHMMEDRATRQVRAWLRPALGAGAQRVKSDLEEKRNRLVAEGKAPHLKAPLQMLARKPE